MENKSIKNVLVMYAKILIGCIIYSASFRFFIYPNDVVLGGVVGAATIINYLT
ncbi:MAG: YitT family protein, partial [Oscillospiraceae bacterium]|nr:YitT family protein [Oscillospiraceae bacterium]